MCEILVQKLLAGTSLVDTERSHLANCESCIAEVVRRLDESAADENGKSGAVNGKLAQSRADAVRAVEHGREVLKRAFGTSPLNK
jgi:hypothetical protein